VLVFTVNVALAAPAGTVTLAGTVAADILLLESETVAPPYGAGPLSITVPVDEEPPLTLGGLTVTEDNVGDPGPGPPPLL
jgi:hypothetical protein